MKKILALLILSIALVSCYKDYVKDFTYSSIYFTYQFDVRTVVVGEGMKVNLGVALGGVDGNKIDRNASFSVDNTLVTPAILTSMKGGANYIKNSVSGVTTLSSLPSNYYTLSDNSNFVIKAGQNSGSIILKADSTNFLADAATLKANYALGLTITSVDADTILPLKRYTVVGLKYENMLFGNYWHGGVTTVKDAGGNVVQTIKYYTAYPTPENTIWTLTTVAPNALVSNGYSNSTTAKQELKLTLNGTDIAVSTGTGSTNTYLPDGTSTFNSAKLLQNRKIVLNYKYVVGANTYYAQDTLTFRNRIRDGVNEWQDENPSHYMK
jgi:hypothetical protein